MSLSKPTTLCWRTSLDEKKNTKNNPSFIERNWNYIQARLVLRKAVDNVIMTHILTQPSSRLTLRRWRAAVVWTQVNVILELVPVLTISISRTTLFDAGSSPTSGWMTSKPLDCHDIYSGLTQTLVPATQPRTVLLHANQAEHNTSDWSTS